MSYIVVEGVIGVGKTVLSKLLGEQLGVPVVLEQFEENPFLSNFYLDRERYAFQTEVFFLLNRYRQQQSVVKPAAVSGSVASDYLFAKTRLFADMNLVGDERALFAEIYDALLKQLAQPTLVVYLTASVSTLMDRIYQRDRSFERSMDPAYIANLRDVYEHFFSRYSDSPMMRIETEELDLVRDRSAQQAVISRIKRAIGE